MEHVAPQVIVEYSIYSVSQTYRDYLTRYVFDAMDQRMSVIDMRRAHRSLLSTLGAEVFSEGLREGGVADEDFADVYKENSNILKGWIADQKKYVDQFAQDAHDAWVYPQKRALILSRIALWVQAMTTLGNLAKMIGLSNRAGTWVMGPTEHCKTCLSLSGKRRRVKWFMAKGYYPRSPNLQCKGFHCLCRIIADDGTQMLP